MSISGLIGSCFLLIRRYCIVASCCSSDKKCWDVDFGGKGFGKMAWLAGTRREENNMEKQEPQMNDDEGFDNTLRSRYNSAPLVIS